MREGLLRIGRKEIAMRDSVRLIAFVCWALYLSASLLLRGGPPIYFFALVCSSCGLIASLVLVKSGMGTSTLRISAVVQLVCAVALILLHSMAWIRDYLYIETWGEAHPAIRMLALQLSHFKIKLMQGLWWSAFQEVILRIVPIVILALSIRQFVISRRSRSS